jgi:RHS repeat-associated protein
VWRRATEVNAKNLPVSESVGGALARSFTYDANGDRIAETDALNQTTRYGLDALRRVTTLTDAANATATLGYDATGALARVSDFAGTPTTFARDLEGRVTQLHYNGFRTYDPLTGRYTQGDPIGLLGGWNRFGYVGANPLGLSDPLGLQAYNGQTPPSSIPGGPWTPQAGQQPSTFQGPKNPNGGGCDMCRYVPDEANG